MYVRIYFQIILYAFYKYFLTNCFFKLVIVFHCNRFTYEYTQLQWKEVPRIKNSIYVNETVNFMKFDDAMVKNIFREHKSRLQCRSAFND